MFARPDMFFYRDPEEVEKEAADAAAAKAAAAEGSAEAAPEAPEWDAALPALSAQPAGESECRLLDCVLCFVTFG